MSGEHVLMNQEIIRAVNIGLLSFCSVLAVVLLMCFRRKSMHVRSTRILFNTIAVMFFSMVLHTISLIYDSASHYVLSTTALAISCFCVYTVYYLYVLNSVDRLVVLLSAKELLRHIGTPGALIRDYMKTDLITIDAGADREDAAKLVAKYDFIAVPVVDHDGRMLGIITHDDVLDTIIEEMAENAHLSAAVAPLADPYLATDLWTLARKRFTWLAILLFGAVTTALILNGFDSVSKKIVWLVAFLPMIVSTGGNTGGQSATLVITALATGEITLRDWWRIVHREVLMGVLLGVAMGACGLINALLIMGRSVPLTHLMVVPTAVFFVVFSSNLTGALLPLIFQRIGWDPALMSNPFVAGISDTLGTLIYMLLAVIFLL